MHFQILCIVLQIQMELDDIAGLSKDYYSFSYIMNGDSRLISIERIADVENIPQDQIYTEANIVQLIKKALNIKYELVRKPMEEHKEHVNYEEQKNGLLTGTRASVTYDENGYMFLLGLRIGDDTVKEDGILDKEYVYDSSFQMIKEKYADLNLDLKYNYSEDAIEITHNHLYGNCYTFEVVGAKNGKWDEENTFYFYPYISIYNIDDYEIASSMGY